MNNPRVLVTGATGFIGRRLVVALCETGIPVKALCRQSSDADLFGNVRTHVVTVVGDLTQAKSLNGVCEGIDTVFHLAGYAHATDANDDSAAAVHREVTIGGTKALLEEAGRAGVKRFVFVSSVKVMGEGKEGCVNEAAAAAPVTEYGRAKLVAEQLVLGRGKDCGMHVCVLRLPLAYGPGVKGNLLQMIEAIDRDRFPPLPKVNNRRSMVHVDDVVHALCLVAGNSKANGKVYLVTDGQNYSTHDIYLLLRQALGRCSPRWAIPISAMRAAAVVGDMVGRIRGRPAPFNSATLIKLLSSAWYSSDKIESELGFKPNFNLETALPAIVEEYRRGAKSKI